MLNSLHTEPRTGAATPNSLRSRLAPARRGSPRALDVNSSEYGRYTLTGFRVNGRFRRFSRVRVFAGEGLLAEPIAGPQLQWPERVFMVESECGAVALAYRRLVLPLDRLMLADYDTSIRKAETRQ
jgi:hypothetical protein